MNPPSSSTSSFRERAAFLAKCALMAAFVAGGVLSVAPRFGDRYPAVLADKVGRLRAVRGPKIVVIGNSNVAFGIDSKVLSRAFGRPAVNAGLHAGFSGLFQERMAEVNPVPGDVYVLCHARYDDDFFSSDPLFLWTAVETRLPAFALLRLSDVPGLVRGFPDYVRAVLEAAAEAAAWPDGRPGRRKASESAYARRAFDENGDNAFVRVPRYEKVEHVVPPPGPTRGTADRINALARRLREKGAFVVVAAVPVVEDPATDPPEAFDAFREKLAGMLECPVISDWRDYRFPRSFFFDNSLHLTNEGAEKRTERLARDLAAWAAEHPEAGLVPAVPF